MNTENTNNDCGVFSYNDMHSLSGDSNTNTVNSANTSPQVIIKENSLPPNIDLMNNMNIPPRQQHFRNDNNNINYRKSVLPFPHLFQKPLQVSPFLSQHTTISSHR